MSRTLPTTHYPLPTYKSGQSLVEILIAVALGAIFVIAAATVISPALRVNTQASRVQAGIALGRELLDNARVWGEKDWNAVLALATTSANKYHLTTSSSPFTTLAGEESVFVASTTYARYFYIEDAERDSGDLIVLSGGFVDPSTKKITVVYGWAQGATSTLSAYITRSRQRILHYTDWSGGPGEEGPITAANSRFSTSSGIDYTTTTGAIMIKF